MSIVCGNRISIPPFRQKTNKCIPHRSHLVMLIRLINLERGQTFEFSCRNIRYRTITSNNFLLQLSPVDQELVVVSLYTVHQAALGRQVGTQVANLIQILDRKEECVCLFVYLWPPRSETIQFVCFLGFLQGALVVSACPSVRLLFFESRFKLRQKQYRLYKNFARFYTSGRREIKTLNRVPWLHVKWG